MQLQPTPSKRAVLILRDGSHIIMGALDPEVHLVKSFIEVKYHERKIQASLISVDPRKVMYREIIDTPTGQLNDFHPEQE